MEISYADFEKVEIRVGKIVRVEEFAKARKPAYKLWIDFGPLGTKQSSAQITKFYNKEDLIGSQVVAVVNFLPRQVADFMSEVLVLGAVPAEGDVILLKPDQEVELGSRIL